MPNPEPWPLPTEAFLATRLPAFKCSIVAQVAL